MHKIDFNSFVGGGISSIEILTDGNCPDLQSFLLKCDNYGIEINKINENYYIITPKEKEG